MDIAKVAQILKTVGEGFVFWDTLLCFCLFREGHLQIKRTQLRRGTRSPRLLSSAAWLLLSLRPSFPSPGAPGTPLCVKQDRKDRGVSRTHDPSPQAALGLAICPGMSKDSCSSVQSA